jgi:hypothetical protein
VGRRSGLTEEHDGEQVWAHELLLVESFETFYRREQRGLVALAYSLTGNRSAAEDIDLGGTAGELQVSIRTGDAQAVANGTAVQRDLLERRDTAEIYLGTDGDAARAVELYDGTTIVYVRSEETNDARTLDELTEVAVAINRELGVG